LRDASEGGRTTLCRGEARVQTVEHVAAAIWGLGIDDAIVEIEGLEPPAADGSALPFAEAILEAGIEVSDQPRKMLSPASAISISEEGGSITCLPCPGKTILSYHLDYPGEPLAQGSMSIELTPEVFMTEIAPARTFVPAAQVEACLAMGWGQGASTENTLILEGNKARDTELRFPDEPLRHKILDMVGDFSFAGGMLAAHIRSRKSGHMQNRSIIEAVIANCAIRNGGSFVLDAIEIRKLLPHRYPFLLVDRILELEPGKRALGLKNLTINEEFFQGHFPQAPIMPGVLQIEAMAQVGGILLKKTISEKIDGKIAVLASVEKAKMRRGVLPGDQLLIEVTLDKIRSNFGQCSAKATVDGRTVSECTVRFAIVDPSALSGFSG
jgi:UDP-3-O-[3-hydroxymyristoyl] N-acetylglucosamine deacetylase / 3-hydroxyacyl-[acyl-carrier-protein] dehydratase